MAAATPPLWLSCLFIFSPFGCSLNAVLAEVNVWVLGGKPPRWLTTPSCGRTWLYRSLMSTWRNFLQTIGKKTLVAIQLFLDAFAVNEKAASAAANGSCRRVAKVSQLGPTRLVGLMLPGQVSAWQQTVTSREAANFHRLRGKLSNQTRLRDKIRIRLMDVSSPAAIWRKNRREKKQKKNDGVSVV